MSSPSFVPERGEIWYSDGLSGFYAVRLTNGASRPSRAARAGALPGAPLADRTAEHRPRPDRLHPRAAARLPVQPVRKTRRSYRYCVKGSSGRVTAPSFSRAAAWCS